MVERIWDADPDLRTKAEGEREKHKKAKVELDIADARPPEYSDEALALRFSDKHAQSARFVGAWGKWLLWTGTHWQVDSTVRTFNFARIICRIARIKTAVAIASAKTVAATVSLARADRRHAATVEQWDEDPWALNTKGKPE